MAPEDMVYAAYVRCPCGAGLAYERGMDPFTGYWDCSAIMLETAIESGQPDAVQHTAQLPFTFYEILSEAQPSANWRTTRV